MNALQALQMTAGQRVHEQLYGGLLTIFGHEIPCTHTELVADFELEAGQASTSVVETISFRQELVPNSLPEKGVKCVLKMGNGSPPIRLQLWHGGLMPGAFVYKFMAVDENYALRPG